MMKYILIWLPMIFIAVINGTARDLWYKKYVGELARRQISTITLIILFAIYLTIILKKYPLQSEIQALYVGILWLILTLVFEFGFGRISGNSWTFLFDEYNLMKGRIWILIPIWVTIAPYIFFKIKQ